VRRDDAERMGKKLGLGDSCTVGFELNLDGAGGAI
jgi:hypothetical protein